jgi:ligand-binding sensor domain-containing protein
VVVQNAKTYASASVFNGPDLIAIDGSGDVWVGSRPYSSLVRIEPAIAAADCSAGCTNLTQVTQAGVLSDLAIDRSGTVWLALQSHTGGAGSPSAQNSAVSSLSAALALTSVFPNSAEKSGTSNSATIYQQAASTALAVDNAGNLVVAGNDAFNQDGTLDHSLDLVDISASGDVLSNTSVPTQFQGPNISQMAVDAAGNVWTITSGGIVEYPAAAGAAVVFSGGGIGDAVVGLAIDGSGDVWVANSASASDSGSVIKIAPGAAADCSAGCTRYVSSIYLTSPSAIAVDGAGDVWVAASFGTLSGPGAPLYDNSTGIAKLAPGAATDCSAGCTAYVGQVFATPNVELSGLAVDGGGNLWVLSYSNAMVIELPQVAAVTVTPLIAQPR